MVSPDFFPSEIQLQELENKYHISILTLNGKHLNERIYALVYSKNSEIPVSKIANDLYSSISPTNTFCNLIISTSLDQDSNIAKNVQEAYLYALFSAPFGNSSISCSAPINQESLYSISDTIKQFCSSLSKTPTHGDLQNLIQSVINYWKRSNVSQHKLTCELHYFVSNIKHTTKEEEISYPYITEIVSNSQSYEELLKSLQYELEQIYHFTDTSVEIPESSLAETVKVWLDSNFTTQITYKIFPDLFGYNEKYISTLFKKAYGMSPNKYVAKLRLDMAKKLMQCNPSILMKDVATLTGFTDAFYFSRAFKASEGISPNQFLKAIRKDDKNL